MWTATPIEIMGDVAFGIFMVTTFAFALYQPSRKK